MLCELLYYITQTRTRKNNQNPTYKKKHTIADYPSAIYIHNCVRSLAATLYNIYSILRIGTIHHPITQCTRYPLFNTPNSGEPAHYIGPWEPRTSHLTFNITINVRVFGAIHLNYSLRTPRKITWGTPPMRLEYSNIALYCSQMYLLYAPRNQRNNIAAGVAGA